MIQLYETLKKYFGYDQFRELQEEIVTNILNAKDTVAIMPTGAGKSLCYQLPALMSEGITIVISPLISLMKDQVDYLNSIGVEATYLNSSLNTSEYRVILNGIFDNRYKIIYIAPERLESESFLAAINSNQISLTNIIIDEAHCVSRWGHDFRPSYTKIKQFIDSLTTRPTIAAFTATATKDVQEDIIIALGLNKPTKFITSFDRKNLEFKVFLNENKEKYIKDYVKNHSSETGIIYVATRKDAEKLYDNLIKAGIKLAIYHGGLSDSERNKAQEDFIYDRVPVMIATNAFGMGIDKSNVRFVIHYNMPRDLESYYQEAGRAGRDGESSVCILLYSAGDTAIQKYFIDESDLSDDRKSNEYKKLQVMESFCHTSSCLRKYMLEYFGDYSISDECGNCSVCNADTEEKDITLEAQMILSCIHRSGQRFGRSVIVDTLRGSKNQRVYSFHLNELKTYGLMKKYSKDTVDLYMNKLIAEGYIHKTEEQYPILKLTNLSVPLLKNQSTLIMQVAKKEVKKESDNVLLTKLKELRFEIATKEGYPPYVIFHDSTLLEMSSRLPTTLSELGDVKGVGESKLVKYGKLFLDVILSYAMNTKVNQRDPSKGNDSQYEYIHTQSLDEDEQKLYTLHSGKDNTQEIAQEITRDITQEITKEITQEIRRDITQVITHEITQESTQENVDRHAKEIDKRTLKAVSPEIKEKGYQKYYKLYSQGKTIEEIIETLNVAISTVEKYLLIAYQEGEDIDIDEFVQEEYEHNVVDVILSKHWNGTLRYIKERVSEEVSYLTIKAVIAKLKFKLLRCDE